MSRECQCTMCTNLSPCDEMSDGICLDCKRELEELEKDDFDQNWDVVEDPIQEGDYCICTFKDCALKFWFKREQILKARIVQQLTSTPNKIWFEGIDSDFYVNSFKKIVPHVS